VLTALSQRRPRVRIPSRPPHRVVAQLGRARASGARGHRFESGQPDDGPAHAGGPHRKMALSGGQPASKTGPSATTRVRLLHLPRDHLPRDHLPLAQRTERLGPNETDPGSSPGREARRHDARSAMGRLSSFHVGEVGSSPTRATTPFRRRSTAGRGAVTSAMAVRICPPKRDRHRSTGAAAQLVVETCLMNRPWWVRFPRGARPCSSMGERLPYKQDGGGSNPSAGTVTVVYRRCIPDRDSGGPGSTPGGHPRWVRHRW
jgi:hypothetical protein